MTQVEWLVDYIAKAFAGGALDVGIEIHAAQSMGVYGNPEEDQLSHTAERNDWQHIKMQTLQPSCRAVTFLDVKRFSLLRTRHHDRVIESWRRNQQLVGLASQWTRDNTPWA